MGAIVGGVIIFYLLGKVVEWAVWTRVFRNFNVTVWASSLSVLLLIFVLWFIQRDKPYALNPAMLIDYTIASFILPLIRMFWNKKKTHKKLKSLSTQDRCDQ